jgi:hypothetical protein
MWKVDKAYLETPGKIAIIDHAKRRTYVVLKEGLPDCGISLFLFLSKNESLMYWCHNRYLTALSVWYLQGFNCGSCNLQGLDLGLVFNEL